MDNYTPFLLLLLIPIMGIMNRWRGSGKSYPTEENPIPDGWDPTPEWFGLGKKRILCASVLAGYAWLCFQGDFVWWSYLVFLAASWGVWSIKWDEWTDLGRMGGEEWSDFLWLMGRGLLHTAPGLIFLGSAILSSGEWRSPLVYVAMGTWMAGLYWIAWAETSTQSSWWNSFKKTFQMDRGPALGEFYFGCWLFLSLWLAGHHDLLL